MNKERLLTLAVHLRNPEARIHPEFNFCVVNSFDKKTRKGISHCGTTGCAMGETPALWPDEVSFAYNSVYNLCYQGKEMPYENIAAVLFDIGPDEAITLFSPDCELPWWPKGNATHHILRGNAEPEEVAESIERFVNWKLLLPNLKEKK